MIRIIEVGPRDGLQNESTPLSTDLKLTFVKGLAEAGLREIEAASFVSPKWVPQLSDAAEVWRGLPVGPLYWALVPNLKGLENALAAGAKNTAVFTAASDAFSMKNINMTVDQSLEVFAEVVQAFREAAPEGRVRGYVSTAFECPYAGRVLPAKTAEVARRLFEIGVDEVSIADTIGAAVPNEVEALLPRLMDVAAPEKFACHFHDTRGTAIANVAEALEHGIQALDSSAGGLGGCPYAPGAGGNLATEDLVYFLERSGIPTGVDLGALARASLPVLEALGRPPAAKSQLAALAESPPTK